MSGGALAVEQLKELLPDGWRIRVAATRLELTPHRAFRFVLLDREGSTIAVAHLDDAARRCLPKEAESLSEQLRAAIPEPLVRGELGGRSFCIRPYLPGASLDTEFGAGDPLSLLREAEALLALVQGEQRDARVFDEAEFERFVELPAAWIRGCARFIPEDGPRLDSLVDAARQLAGKRLEYCLHHGDFQFSNLLRGDDGRLQIIDWELSQSPAPLWMDRVHLAIAHTAATGGCSYGEAAQRLQTAWLGDRARLPYSFTAEASKLDDASRRGLFILCTLHGMSHFLRRVPHLANRGRVDDFLRAGEAFLKL